MTLRENKNYLYQFLPREFNYLTKQKTIIFNEHNLKTDYLINIMHDLILKYYFTNEIEHNLSSKILKKKYGKIYNCYIDYLCDIKFMNLTSNYFVGKKSKSYKLNITVLDIIRYKIEDKILLKKYKMDYISSITTEKDSPIDINLRKILVDDLYHVDLDYSKSYKWLKEAKDNNTLEISKYFKNMSSIDGVESGYIYFKFDSYGRFHTNFTVLKKHIRENYITIDGEEIIEFDIKNSQPLFFAKYLKNEIGENNFNDEIWRYIDCVKNGLIYDQLLQTYPDEIHNRHEAKILMYKLLFGLNKDFKKESILFKKLYPTVYEYIKDFKDFSDSYKKLSHHLQALESEFIFNKVITDIKKKFPHIKLFTVHDSIVCQKKYKEEVGVIFRKHLKELI